ncbi:MAG: TonB C-terminal domain-containing protein [Flavobacterium sp.]|nr:TonB C-terminal domain-containing protein [Flavobacterium sp.]
MNGILHYENLISEILLKGKTYEVAVLKSIRKLRKTMSAMNNAWMPEDIGIEDIVLLPPENNKISQEIDGLIITSFGVFLIEIKGWKGRIFDMEGKFYCGDKERISPEDQSKNKLKRILSLIGMSAPVYPLYVFSHPLVKLSPDLPSNFVVTESIQNYFMEKRDSHLSKNLPSINIEKVVESLTRTFDKNDRAKERHLISIADFSNEPNEDALLVKNSRNQINNLYEEMSTLKVNVEYQILISFIPLLLLAMSFSRGFSEYPNINSDEPPVLYSERINYDQLSKQEPIIMKANEAELPKNQIKLLKSNQKPKEQKIYQELDSAQSSIEDRKKVEIKETDTLANEYIAKIMAKILGNLNKSLCGNGNPELKFEIGLLQTGELSGSPKLVKSSGSAACDEAAERAIIASEPLPLPSDTLLFSQFKNLTLKFLPND